MATPGSDASSGKGDRRVETPRQRTAHQHCGGTEEVANPIIALGYGWSPVYRPRIVAERLRSGLQTRVPRFDSGRCVLGVADPGLHKALGRSPFTEGWRSLVDRTCLENSKSLAGLLGSNPSPSLWSAPVL